MTNGNEINRAKKNYERLTEQLHETCEMLRNTPTWNTEKCKSYVDNLFIQTKNAEAAYCKLSGKRFAWE